MENSGNKKLALIYILKILQEHSDYDHPLTHEDLASYLEKDYGVVIERKAVARNLSLLKEAGYAIESVRRGSYIEERLFEDFELRCIIDGILSSRYIYPKQVKSMVERLSSLANKYFKYNIKHIRTLSDYEKTENVTVFYAIEMVEEAIEQKRQLSFEYYCFGDDKKVHLDKKWVVTPVQLIVKNQFYYLIAVVETEEKKKIMKAFRMDLISAPKIEDTKALTYTEQNYKDFIATHPYMKDGVGKPEKVVFLCYAKDLDLVIENLGTNIKITTFDHGGEEETEKPVFPEGMVEITAILDIENAVEFVCRYPQKVFIVSPGKVSKRVNKLYSGALKMTELIAKEYLH